MDDDDISFLLGPDNPYEMANFVQLKAEMDNPEKFAERCIIRANKSTGVALPWRLGNIPNDSSEGQIYQRLQKLNPKFPENKGVSDFRTTLAGIFLMRALDKAVASLKPVDYAARAIDGRVGPKTRDGLERTIEWVENLLQDMEKLPQTPDIDKARMAAHTTLQAVNKAFDELPVLPRPEETDRAKALKKSSVAFKGEPWRQPEDERDPPRHR